MLCRIRLALCTSCICLFTAAQDVLSADCTSLMHRLQLAAAVEVADSAHAHPCCIMFSCVHNFIQLLCRTAHVSTALSLKRVVYTWEAVSAYSSSEAL